MLSFAIFFMGSCLECSGGGLGCHGPGPHGPPSALMGLALKGRPWALKSRDLAARLGPHGLSSCGLLWALVGRALWAPPPGPSWAGPS